VSAERHTRPPVHVFPYDVAALDLLDTDRAAADAPLFEDFVAIVRRLRRDCPWDREQTHASTAHLTLEEAYEVADAVERGEPRALAAELGDLFLHVLFHADIAETAGTFTLSDVMRAEMAKLVRRHPHVFGDEAVGGTGEVLRNWEAIKQAERAEAAGAGDASPSALDGVPAAMPALLRAERVQYKAAAVGFDFPDAEGAWAKVVEETQEVRELLDSDAPAEALESEIGDLLFAVVNVARMRGVVPETALRGTVERFSRRFRHVEAGLAVQDRTPATATLAEMDALWDEAKAIEKARPTP
jgi:XTP/dITP diphosphohydrolase/tetrapyrrole methylase family protein/MazG family protein